MSDAIVVSTAEEMLPAATAELRAALPGVRVEPLAPGTGLLTGDLDLATVARICRETPVVFVRHLMREIARLPLAELQARPDRLGEAAVAVLRAEPHHEIALQLWQAGNPDLPHRPDELWHMVADRLTEAGQIVRRAGQEWTLSVCLTPVAALLGLNRSSEALADWPGGRVKLARGREQISRAEFKLEELSKVAPVALPASGVALDLGASPGGWTRVLRQAGLEIWAIDPADLDSRLGDDPRVHHVRATAGRFLAETDQTFDVVVNDMRMTAEQSATVMLSAARHLAPGGLAIMTLKLAPHDPLRTVRNALETLARAYDVTFARQLHHNRHEVTVVGRKR